MPPLLKRNSVLFGLVTGLTLAVVVTLVVTVWQWLENRSGRFHSEAGTDWEMIANTVVAWFMPVFLDVTLIAFFLHLVYRAVLRVLGRNFDQPPDD
ncbi:MAG: hypothetical protein KDI36_02755 [Pseudomonadales bacterium]|nr:hypothetical protein [Pseudomonadales bacterium]